MFHVVEAARVTEHPYLATDSTAGNNGAFDMESCEPGWRLALICSDGTEPECPPEGVGWEHVSVHSYRKDGKQQRTPTWREMAFVKTLMWDDEDVVVQFHPRKSEYVNLHPHVLHLWRSRLQTFPTPDPILVGPMAGVR